MSSKRCQSQRIPFNAKKEKIDHCFHQADETQQKDPSLPQTSMNYAKCPKDVTNLQAQGPTEQPVPPTKTMNVTLKGDHRDHVVTCSEGDSLYKALTSLQAVREKIETQKGKEMLVRGTAGIEGYISLGMPLSCFPENCHLEITFVQSGTKQKRENQEFARCSKESSKCVKFYIHAVGKELIRIVKSKHLHRKDYKLCIFGLKEETIRQALCRDGRLRSFLESGVWKLIENRDTVLENTQLVGDLEGRVFEVEFEKRKLTRANTGKNSESEKTNPTPFNEEIVEQFTSWKKESEKISDHITWLSTYYETDFVTLPQNAIPITHHKLLARLANSVGLIEWDNGTGGSGTCFVYFGSYICTCSHVIRGIVGEGVELHNSINIISQHAKVTFDYEDPWREENNRYFSIDPSFLVSNEKLDVAVLKLKENRQVPLGLYLSFHSPPLTGMIHIIGHPDGEVKRLDTGVVIPPSQREEEYLKCVEARKAGVQSDDIFISENFQDIANDPDMMIYHCSLSSGSSGSPVFDSSGALVAMHLGSIYRNGESAIGYGVSEKSFMYCESPTKSRINWLMDLKTVTTLACCYTDAVEMESDEEN